jgi:outer membrane protein TolC
MKKANQFSDKLKIRRSLFLLLIMLFPFNIGAQTVINKISNITPAIAVNPIDTIKPLTLDEAVNLAEKQASDYTAARLNSRLAQEDIKQAKASFYPRVAIEPNVIFTSPSFSKTVGIPRQPSFLGANAITEYQALINVAGEIDTSGKLRATLRKNQALLEAANAGTLAARLNLENTVTTVYYALALATAKRRGAEENLDAARKFENVTKLLVDGGEVAPVDLTRARLQTAQKLDELEQASTIETTSGNALKGLTGINFTETIAATDLNFGIPAADEIENISQTEIKNRPEFAQFEAERKAAEEDAKIARAMRRPQFTYSVSGGFISDSLIPNNVPKYVGVQANVGLTIPLFDRGTSKSQQTQAEIRASIAENNRKMAERNFAEQFFSARAEAENAALRIKQIAASISDAEKNISASTARYQAGEAQINEVTDAQNTLTTLRNALYQAIYDYQIARSRLFQAVGK